ncbi:ComEC/Rec2 family competence protein [Niameybacter massiliensis]|uniref:ComEC/Rec2 family competence protein n=1 Tax=Niameybacter massiliensis TaxID=1658108 RepID=UPI0012B52A6C|nr:hypothetical protein [Niameybacter massiliensis]
MNFYLQEMLAGKDVEKSILDKMIDIDVLKVGHHGSNTSTSKEFLDKVKPEIAVITCGKDNKYGHPHKEVSDRLKDIKTYRTDLNGNIIITSDEKILTISTQKVDGKVMQTPIVTKVDTISNTINNVQISTNPTNTIIESTTIQSTGQKVWVTGTGKKYHYKACRYINTTSRELTVDDAKKQGYEACKVCY